MQPIKIGNQIEVVSIDNEGNAARGPGIGMILHFDCEPQEIAKTFDEQSPALIKFAIKYLREQGFLNADVQYIMQIVGVSHPHNKENHDHC